MKIRNRFTYEKILKVPGKTLQSADLSWENLSWENLSGADLTGANTLDAIGNPSGRRS